MNNHSLFANYPGKEALLQGLKSKSATESAIGERHFHTPFSFSAFTEIEQVFRMAKTEGVQVLGINDFYTTDGYTRICWVGYAIQDSSRCSTSNLWRCSAICRNMESGWTIRPIRDEPTWAAKELTHPFKIGKAEFALLEQVSAWKQCADCRNGWKTERPYSLNWMPDLVLPLLILKVRYAKNMLARAAHCQSVAHCHRRKIQYTGRKESLLLQVFSGKEVKSDLNDMTGLENEIRGNLLKAGGKAFVAEDRKHF